MATGLIRGRVGGEFLEICRFWCLGCFVLIEFLSVTSLKYSALNGENFDFHGVSGGRNKGGGVGCPDLMVVYMFRIYSSSKEQMSRIQ